MIKNKLILTLSLISSMIVGFISGGYFIYKDIMHYVNPLFISSLALETSINAYAITLIKEKNTEKAIAVLCTSINEWRHSYNPPIKYDRNVTLPVKLFENIMPMTSIQEKYINIEKNNKIIMKRTKHCASYYEKDYKANK